MSKAVVYVQCKLFAPPTTMLTAWIEKHPNLKKGAHVTLKEFGTVTWTVCDVYDGVEMEESILKRHQQLHRGSLPSVEGMHK